MSIDIVKTYRKEKDSHKLLELPPGWFDQADESIRLMQSEQPGSDLEADLGRQEILSAIRSLELLSDLRIKKVLKGAIADAYRKEPEHGNDFFTDKESKLYKNIVAGIKEIKGAKA